jgi:5S rRNA maturation endonuclease (ribonuclease M5)
MDLKQMQTKTSHSIDQDTLKCLCDALCDDIEKLLDTLELEYRKNDRFVTMSCPIHGGDNDSALNLYYTGDNYRGNWKCRTHQCEKIFKGSIIGFVRGVLSNQKYQWQNNGDKTVSFKDTLEFIRKIVHFSPEDIKISNTDKEKKNFTKSLANLKKPTVQYSNTIDRTIIRKNLTIPSPYFISRGFNPEILDKYDVGDCITSNKEMYNRAVVPIYDNDNKYMIGCSGRTINSQQPKWKHSKGFSAENCLYNFWFAKDYIKTSKTAIIVESPGNVWRLEENGIHNAVGIFGSNLTDRQKMLLDISGAMKLIIITDSDDAGDNARIQIEQKCNKIYNIEHIRVSRNDIAELTNEEIVKEIKQRIS